MNEYGLKKAEIVLIENSVSKSRTKKLWNRIFKNMVEPKKKMKIKIEIWKMHTYLVNYEFKQRKLIILFDIYYQVAGFHKTKYPMIKN